MFYKPVNVLWFALLTMLMAVGCRSTKQTARDPFSSQSRPAEKIEQLESTVLLIDATKQRLLGNWANAVVLYAEAIKRDPENGAAFFELARLHARMGQFRDAEKFAQRAVFLEPENTYYLLALSDIFFLQEKNEDALAIQKKLAEKNPYNLNFQVGYFGSLVYLGRLDKALEVLNHMEAIRGFSDELSIQKQQILLNQNRLDEAIEEAKRLISWYPDEMMYLEMLAEMYTEAGEPEKAYLLYQQMLEVNPHNAMARLLLADYYKSDGNEEKAFEHLLIAFQNPDLPLEGKMRIMYTYYHASEGDEFFLSQAYQLCEVLLEHHAGEEEAYALYADFLYRDERLAEAREKYYLAAKLNPAEVGYWQQVLVIDSRLEDYQAMLEASEEALEYFFENAILYLFNGIAHMHLKNFEQAIEAFDYGKNLSLSNKDLNSQFLTLLGDTYYKDENYEASFKSYRLALAVNPDNTFALNNYSYYLSLRNKELEKALEMSARANKLEGNNSAFQDTYGWIKYKMGDYTEARRWIEKAIQNSETPSAAILEHYGDVLYKLGEKEDAWQYWEQALQKHLERESLDETSEFLKKKVKDKTLYE